MKIELFEINGIMIAEIISDKIVIKDAQDAVDIMGNCSYQGAHKIIIRDTNVSSDFFDLKTGVAGEILQKFSTYNVRLAIVGDFTKYPSKSLRDFIFESNKYKRINFVKSIEAAKDALIR